MKYLTRQTVLAISAFVIIAACLSVQPAAGKEQTVPNIIVIFCDDLGYGDLGVMGHPTIRTPNVDQMAKEGQRWTQFYVAAPVCTPSRAALLTGRLPVRSGMMSDGNNRVLFPDSYGGLPQSELTIAELLKSAGYATAAFGKWHLGHLPEFLPTAHGFDTYWGIPYSNDMDKEPGYPNYMKQAHKDAHYLAPIAQFNVPILEDTKIVERPADQFTITHRLTSKTIDFIEKQADGPFFVYLAHSLPHIPLYAWKDRVGQSKRGLYGDVVEEIDFEVGRILGKLKELGLEENTLVVFTSDNGPWLSFNTHGGSAGLLHQGKGTTYEGGMRVPGIFWWPGRVKPGVQMGLGSTLDLLPTFCNLADIDIPHDRILDGFDLSPVLFGESNETKRNEMYYWRESELYAIRSGPWKAHYITQGCYGIGEARKDHSVPQLFHLDHDPGEQYNIAGGHPEVLERMQALYDKHTQSIEPVENQLAKRQ